MGGFEEGSGLLSEGPDSVGGLICFWADGASPVAGKSSNSGMGYFSSGL